MPTGSTSSHRPRASLPAKTETSLAYATAGPTGRRIVTLQFDVHEGQPMISAFFVSAEKGDELSYTFLAEGRSLYEGLKFLLGRMSAMFYDDNPDIFLANDARGL